MKDKYVGSQREKEKNRRGWHRRKHSFNHQSRQIYCSQRRASEKRGHNYPSYTLGEFREWLLDNSFSILYDKFVESDCDKWMKPSVDRIDSKKGYSLSNIQILTWRENWEKGLIERSNDHWKAQKRTSDGRFKK